MRPPAILLAVEWDGTAGPSATQHDGAGKATHVLVGQGDIPAPRCRWACPASWHGGDGREREGATGTNQKAIIERPLLTAPSRKGWRERLVMATVTPVPSVPRPGPSRDAPAVGWHTLITSPIAAVNLPWG